MFVHIGALSTLHRLSGLAKARNKQHSLQFITYGTHPTVHPSRWGIHEIFPLGKTPTLGALTFYD